MTQAMPRQAERVFGRYALFDEIAAGGMATVHLGRLIGPVGFSKTVAIKRLHPNLARDPEFVSMFLDEARLAARIHHPNVVSTLDVVAVEGEVFLVLDYVQGESLSHLLKAMRANRTQMDPRVVAAIIVNALHGLHAAHIAQDEYGRPLGIVHRDVSPQNIMVGTDGVARVLDFGVAKAAGRLQSTRDGQLKGKLAYMAPEQVQGQTIDTRTDTYAAAVVLWEALAGRRLISAKNEAEVLHAVLTGGFPPPSSVNPHLPQGIDGVVMRGLQQDPAVRYPSAREMAIAVERTLGIASAFEVGEWVERMAPDALALRAARVREMESTSAVHMIPAGAGQGGAPAPVAANPHEISDVSAPGGGVPRPPPLEASYPSQASASYPSAVSQASQVSQVSQPWSNQPQVAAPQQRSNSRLVLMVVGITGAVGVAGIVALAAWRLHNRSAATAPTASAAALRPVAPAPSAGSPAAEATAAEPSPSGTEAAAQTEPAESAEAPASAESAEPAPPAPTAPVVAAKPHPVVVRHHAATGAVKKSGSSAKTKAKAKENSCDSPFYVDSKGIKHIRPECM